MDSNIICKISGIDPSQIERICVDDNGCSNKVVYTLECTHPDTEYKLLFNTPSGYLTNGSRFLIGENLESSDFKDFASYDRILINFKAKPTKENRSVIKNYLKAWHEKITKKWKEYKNEETTLWIAGCPNSWEKKDIDAYRKIYNDAGYENVIIFPEGHAALLRNILLDEKGTPLYKSVRWVRKRILNTATVCVDCGGYSNEATLINEKGVRTISSGTVGSHIIDIMIICANLYDEEIEIHTDYDSEEDYEENSSTQKENFIKKYKMVGKDYEGVSLPPEEVREEMRKRFETDKKFRAFLILQGRWLKERFLNAEESNGVKFYRLTVTLDKPIPLGQNGSVSTYTFYINSRMINWLIQSAPIKKTLGDKIFATLPNETREEIGDKNTWIDCYYNFIEEAAKHCSYYPDSQKFEIILTGGASKTELVRTTTHLTFKPYYTSENNKLKLDPTPFTSIATGLCTYGFEKLRSMLFDHACKQLLEVPRAPDEQGNKITEVQYYAEAFWEEFCTGLTEAIASEAARLLEDTKNKWLNKDYKVGCYLIVFAESEYNKERCAYGRIKTYIKSDDFDNQCNEQIKEKSNEYFQPNAQYIFNYYLTNTLIKNTKAMDLYEGLKIRILKVTDNLKDDILNSIKEALKPVDKFCCNYSYNHIFFERMRWHDWEFGYKVQDFKDSVHNKINNLLHPKKDLFINSCCQAVTGHLYNTRNNLFWISWLEKTDRYRYRINLRYINIKAPKIILPCHVKVIGERTVSDSKISSMYIPPSVTSIKEYAFFNFKNLKHIYIPKSVTEIVDDLSRFEGGVFDYSARRGTGMYESDHIHHLRAGCETAHLPFEEDKCEKLIIHCERGSYAEDYARHHHLCIEYI